MRHKNNIIQASLLSLLVSFLTACAPQYTPSMMNTSSVELARESIVEQIPLASITPETMTYIAQQYQKNGNGILDLTMTYDPRSKDFTAMNAVHGLQAIEKTLKQNGVTQYETQTLAVPDGKPSLMVSYDMIRAQAPSDCQPMPGLDTNETGRFIGDYKFGCGIETAIAKQIARPADLEGNATLDRRTARRDSVVIEGYSAGVPREPIVGIEREDLVSE